MVTESIYVFNLSEEIYEKNKKAWLKFKYWI